MAHGDLRRFERERAILSRLRHPNIATLFDGGEVAGRLLYYTMEWVDGEDITRYAHAHLGSVEARVELLLKVASALAYAHQNLVIHRDIKPSNILVTSHGEPKLLDFGIAKPMDGSLDADLSHTTVGPMTPEYAAPEQFRRDAITVATDVFQFATLCHRVLSGGSAYRVSSEDRIAWTRAVLEDEPVSLARAASATEQLRGWSAIPGVNLSGVHKRLRGDLDAIVRKGLSKAPADRYSSMEAMIRDLQRFLDRRPVSARRATALYFAWRWAARRPYVSAGALASVLALLVTTLAAVQQARVARAEAERAHHEAERADQMSEFLTSLFKVSDPGVNRGEHLSANDILERGAERIRRELPDQPEQRARLLGVIGGVYTALGDWSRAEPLLTEQVDVLRRLPESRFELGHALRTLGASQDNLGGNPDAAVELLAEADTQLAALDLPRAHEERALVLAYLSTIHSDRGAYAAASADLATALEEARRADVADKITGAVVHHNSGRLFLRIGRPAAARDEFDEAASIYSRELGADHYRTLRSLSGLASALAQMGQPTPARTLMLSVIDIQRRVVGERSAAYAQGMETLGTIEQLSGNSRRCRSRLRRVRNHLERRRRPSGPRTRSDSARSGPTAHGAARLRGRARSVRSRRDVAGRARTRRSGPRVHARMSLAGAASAWSDRRSVT